MSSPSSPASSRTQPGLASCSRFGSSGESFSSSIDDLVVEPDNRVLMNEAKGVRQIIEAHMSSENPFGASRQDSPYSSLNGSIRDDPPATGSTSHASAEVARTVPSMPSASDAPAASPTSRPASSTSLAHSTPVSPSPSPGTAPSMSSSTPLQNAEGSPSTPVHSSAVRATHATEKNQSSSTSADSPSTSISHAPPSPSASASAYSTSQSTLETTSHDRLVSKTEFMSSGDSSDEDDDYDDYNYEPVEVNKDTVLACLERLNGTSAPSSSLPKPEPPLVPITVQVPDPVITTAAAEAPLDSPIDPAALTPSEEGRLMAIKRMLAHPPSASSTGSSSKSKEIRAENELLRKEIEKMERLLAQGKPYSTLNLSSDPYSSMHLSSGSHKAKRENDNLRAKAATMANFLKAVEEGKRNGGFEAGRISESVDVCFLLDCTGSMGKWIAAAQTKMVDIIDQVKREFPRHLTRVAFVGYRDFDGIAESKRADEFVIVDFNEDVSAVRDSISGVRATGGGDGAEDVFGGFEKCLALNWRAESRLIIHFADAPGHGSLYNGNVGDNHRYFDADGSKGRAFMQTMVDKNIHYYFGKITEHTNAMTKKLKEFYDEAQSKRYAAPAMVIIEMGSEPSRFLEDCVYAITTSINSRAGRLARS